MCSQIFGRGVFGAAAIIGLLCLAERAIGADYAASPSDFMAPPVADKVDFATNWYVRGDLAYAAETFPKLSSGFTYNPALSPAYALNQTSPALNNFSASAGMGYRVNDWFRTDLILDYRSPVQVGWIGPQATCITGVDQSGTVTATDLCTSHLNTEMHRWDLLANGYFDIGTWQGLTPYIGAGAGLTWARIKQSVNWTMSNGLSYQVSTNGFYFNNDRSLGQMSYQFAWAVMAGVAVAVMDHALLDVGYRFLNLGTVSGISSVTATPVTQRVLANEVRAGLRYTID